MINQRSPRRNLFISLIFVIEILCLVTFFLFFQKLYLSFPALVALLFSASFLILVQLEFGLIIYILEVLFLILIFLITKYPLSLSVLYILTAGLLGVKSTLKKKKNRDKLDTLSLELESIRERTNINKTQYLELTKINEALEKKILRFTGLRKFSEEILASLDLEELLKIIASKTLEIIAKGEVCLIYLFERKTESLYLARSFTLSPKIKIKAKKGDPCEYWVFRQRVPLLIPDILRDFRFDSEEVFSYGREFRSLISAPVISRNKFLGLIRIDSSYPGEFTPDDLRLLDIIADLSAIAIDNAFLFRKMEELATQDSLTGFYLRREFLKLLQEELEKFKERRELFALLMLDIDDFKNCNDNYGHIAGDMVLKNISRVIKAYLVDGEYPCRYGGEEFLLFLRGRDRNHLLQRARLIKDAIGTSVVKIRRQEIAVTVSIGVAIYPEDALNSARLIELADARLYQAKGEGKNKVVYE